MIFSISWIFSRFASWTSQTNSGWSLRSAGMPVSDVVPQSFAQRVEVDRVHAARAGKVERVRRARAHGDARPHDAHAGERRRVAVDAAPGGDEVVAVRGQHAAQGHGMDVVVAE